MSCRNVVRRPIRANTIAYPSRTAKPYLVPKRPQWVHLFHRALTAARPLVLSSITMSQSPGAAYVICEDYRAAAGIDLEHDPVHRDAGRSITKLVPALWGEQGVAPSCFNPLEDGVG